MNIGRINQVAILRPLGLRPGGRPPRKEIVLEEHQSVPQQSGTRSEAPHRPDHHLVALTEFPKERSTAQRFRTRRLYRV